MSTPKKKQDEDEGGTRIFNYKDIPAPVFFRMKEAAAAEHMTLRQWLDGLVEKRIKELERDGTLGKAKS